MSSPDVSECNSEVEFLTSTGLLFSLVTGTRAVSSGSPSRVARCSDRWMSKASFACLLASSHSVFVIDFGLRVLSSLLNIAFVLACAVSRVLCASGPGSGSPGGASTGRLPGASTSGRDSRCPVRVSSSSAHTSHSAAQISSGWGWTTPRTPGSWLFGPAGCSGFGWDFSTRSFLLIMYKLLLDRLIEIGPLLGPSKLTSVGACFTGCAA